MPSIDPGQRRHRSRTSRTPAFRPAIVAALVGLALTGMATLHAHRTIRAEEEGRFHGALVAAQEAIDGRMDACVTLLLAERGLFLASDAIEQDEFQEWADALQLGERYPGIDGIGFAAVVPPGGTKAFEAEIRASGGPDFTVNPPGDRPLLSSGPGPERPGRDPEANALRAKRPGAGAAFRPLVSSIRFLEPDNPRNHAGLGSDMLSDPVRRAAMERSRDTGLPSASGPVALVDEATPKRRAGFFIYVPVYRHDRPVGTVAERHAALEGWVYASFRSQELLDGIFRRQRPQVHIEAYDGTVPTPDGLLFETHEYRELVAHDARDFRVRTLDVAGRPWTLVFRPIAGAANRSRALPPLVGLAGLLCCVLLFCITWEQTRDRRRERVARAAAERAEAEATFLADASELLASSLDVATMMDRLARRMVPFLGEVCVVDVIGDEGNLSRLAISTADESRLADAIGLARRHYPTGSPAVKRVIATGMPEILPEIDEEWLAKAYPEPGGRAVISSFGCRSVAILPLSTRDRIHGALLLASGEPNFFRRSRRTLVKEVARRAAQAIETAWLYRQTQEAVRLRDDFLSIASHELRTPLTSLQAQVQGLRRTMRRPEGLEPEKLEAKLEVIERQVRRLGRLVTDLLDVARIRTGRFEIHRERFELAELFEDALGRLGDGYELPEISVSATGPAVGSWDRFRLEQVALNLLGNALKYGAGKPIDVRIVPGPAGVRFSVRDRGIGIPREKQAIVFERFARAVSDRNYGGLGLGLFIVREIVQSHGGNVSLESVPGEGSVFTVELPWGNEKLEARRA